MIIESRMKAENTIMSDGDIRNALKLAIDEAQEYGDDDLPLPEKEIAKAQAEISFKAGYNKALAQLADMTEECKQMGRKEVVEWTAREFGIDWSEEKKQLQEWGIDA